MYLGATFSKEGEGTQDIDNGVVKARGVFTRLRKICSTNINRRTKIRLYKPVLMYGWKICKMNNSDQNKSDRCLPRRMP